MAGLGKKPGGRCGSKVSQSTDGKGKGRARAPTVRGQDEASKMADQTGIMQGEQGRGRYRDRASQAGAQTTHKQDRTSSRADGAGSRQARA